MRTLLAFLLLPLLALASHHARDTQLHRRHYKQRADMSRLGRRDIATFYDVGLGACGWMNVDSDFVIAISHDNWDNGAHCGKWVSVTYNGQTKQAQIVDECMGCDSNHIDLSRGLFSSLADQSLGTLNIDWSGLGGGGGNPPPPPKPQSSPTWTSSSSSTWKPPKTTTSASAASTSIWTSRSSTSTTVTTSTSISKPTPTVTPTSTPSTPQNLAELNLLVVALARFVLSSE